MIFQKKVNSFLALVILTIINLCLIGCNPRELPIIKEATKNFEQESTKQTEEAIKNSPELKELDSICNQIPLPEDFRFVWKGGLDDKRTTISYYYYSETKYEVARKLFEEYFKKNNWEFTNEYSDYPRIIEFRNDKYIIGIQHGGMGKRTTYSINCEKISVFSK